MILSYRARYTMAAFGTRAISDLAKYTEAEVGLVKGCGKLTLRELRAALQSIALDFAPPPNAPTSGDVPEYPPEQEIEHVADLEESCGSAGLGVWRLAVPGGWLYVTQVSRQSQCAEHGPDCHEVISAIPTFVPDAQAQETTT